jgi:hypothetical protein
LGPSDFSSGLSFVAISCVKTLAEIAFRSGFDYHRLLWEEEVESMKMLMEDVEQRNRIGFQLTHKEWTLHNISSTVEPI